MANFFVPQMLTRNQFALANLLVISMSHVQLKKKSGKIKQVELVIC